MARPYKTKGNDESTYESVREGGYFTNLFVLKDLSAALVLLGSIFFLVGAVHLYTEADTIKNDRSKLDGNFNDGTNGWLFLSLSYLSVFLSGIFALALWAMSQRDEKYKIVWPASERNDWMPIAWNGICDLLSLVACGGLTMLMYPAMPEGSILENHSDQATAAQRTIAWQIWYGITRFETETKDGGLGFNGWITLLMIAAIIRVVYIPVGMFFNHQRPFYLFPFCLPRTLCGGKEEVEPNEKEEFIAAPSAFMCCSAFAHNQLGAIANHRFVTHLFVMTGLILLHTHDYESRAVYVPWKTVQDENVKFKSYVLNPPRSPCAYENFKGLQIPKEDQTMAKSDTEGTWIEDADWKGCYASTDNLFPGGRVSGKEIDLDTELYLGTPPPIELHPQKPSCRNPSLFVTQDPGFFQELEDNSAKCAQNSGYTPQPGNEHALCSEKVDKSSCNAHTDTNTQSDEQQLETANVAEKNTANNELTAKLGAAYAAAAGVAASNTDATSATEAGSAAAATAELLKDTITAAMIASDGAIDDIALPDDLTEAQEEFVTLNAAKAAAAAVVEFFDVSNTDVGAPTAAMVAADASTYAFNAWSDHGPQTPDYNLSPHHLAAVIAVAGAAASVSEAQSAASAAANDSNDMIKDAITLATPQPTTPATPLTLPQEAKIAAAAIAAASGSHDDFAGDAAMVVAKKTATALADDMSTQHPDSPCQWIPATTASSKPAGLKEDYGRVARLRGLRMNQFHCYGNQTDAYSKEKNMENRPFKSNTPVQKAKAIGGVVPYEADDTTWVAQAYTCCGGLDTVEETTDTNDLGYTMYQMSCLFIAGAVVYLLAALAIFIAYVAYNIDPTPSSVPKSTSQYNFSPI